MLSNLRGAFELTSIFEYTTNYANIFMFKAGRLGKSQKRPAHKLLVSEIANHGDVGEALGR